MARRIPGAVAELVATLLASLTLTVAASAAPVAVAAAASAAVASAAPAGAERDHARAERCAAVRPPPRNAANGPRSGS